MPKLHFLLKFSANGFTTSRSKSFDASRRSANSILVSPQQILSTHVIRCFEIRSSHTRIKVIVGVAASEFFVSSALRAGQPRCLLRAEIRLLHTRIKVILGVAASEFLVSSALRAGQPRCLRRFAPVSQSFDASRRPSALRASLRHPYSY